MSQSHDHSHATTNRRRLSVAIAIIGLVLIAQLVGAAISGSLSLLADAGHMLSDLGGLTIALVATVVASRPATDRQTFGYRRAEVFGALANCLILLAVAVFVAYEAVRRLASAGEAEVQSVPMLVVAVFGLLANVAALLVLRPAAEKSINMRGAYLEVFGDLLGSLAVIAAAIVILLTGLVQADAVASLLIAGMIVPRALILLRDVIRVLSNAAPADTDVAQIRRHILETEGVVDVHDVHVWSITSGAPVFSAHVVVEPHVFRDGRAGELLDQLGDCLSGHFDVGHSTFQLEPVEHARHEEQQHR